MAVRQAQEAIKQCLADGVKIIEIDMPTTGLDTVTGDGEGGNEMSLSMSYLRQVLGPWRAAPPTTRVFFPDEQEMNVAMQGQSGDRTGREDFGPVFSPADFQLGFLTRQNLLWAMVGMNWGQGKFSPVQQVAPTDEMLVIAYPSFNPREELSAMEELFYQVAQPRKVPIIIFNGELDRVRNGYFAAMFFKEIARIQEKVLEPNLQTAYYIHNFKGSQPGVLFRCYPGPWQVLRRDKYDTSQLTLIWSGLQMPTLRQVSLEILPET